MPQIGVRLSELTKGRQAAVITDDHVGSLYGHLNKINASLINTSAKTRQIAHNTAAYVGSRYGQIVLDSLAKAGFETFCYTIKAGEESKKDHHSPLKADE